MTSFTTTFSNLADRSSKAQGWVEGREQEREKGLRKSHPSVSNFVTILVKMKKQHGTRFLHQRFYFTPNPKFLLNPPFPLLPPPLALVKNLPHALPGLQIVMSILSLIQPENLVNLNVEFPLLQPSHDLLRPPHELGPVDCIIE